MVQVHKLPPELTLFTAEAVRDQLKQVIISGESVLWDGSQVQAIDGCGLQILLSLEKSLRLAGERLQLIQPSAVLEQVLAEVELGELVRRDLDEECCDCG